MKYLETSLLANRLSKAISIMRKQVAFKFFLAIVSVLVSLQPLTADAKQKVLILYSIGGHSTAAKSIESMLNAHPEEFEVIRHDFAEDLEGFARWFYFGGYDLISRHANFINKMGVTIKWVQAEHMKLFASQRYNSQFNQPDNVLRYIEAVNPDVIITTHFSLADTLALLREQGHLKNIPVSWTHLDAVDNIFFRQIGDQLDMSFLPTQEMADAWKRILGAEKVIASGIPVMPDMLADRSSLSRTTIRNELNLKPDVKTILLMGGSMGALSYQRIIADTIKAYGTTPLQFIAVFGRNEKKRESLIEWSKESTFPNHVKLITTGFINSEEIKRLQVAADLIISKPGGLTTFELLTTDRPVIMTEGIGIQEEYNAQFVHDKNAAIYVKEPKEVGDMVLKILSDEDLQRRLIAGQKVQRSNFNLSSIVDWTRTAKVLQPHRPVKTVLERTKEEAKLLKMATKKKLSCSETLSRK